MRRKVIKHDLQDFFKTMQGTRKPENMAMLSPLIPL